MRPQRCPRGGGRGFASLTCFPGVPPRPAAGDVDVEDVHGGHGEVAVAQLAAPVNRVAEANCQTKTRSPRRQRGGGAVPDEGPEGRGAQPHVALHPQEADEEPGDALHQPQVVELLGVFGVNLLQAQRGQGVLVLRLRLRGSVLAALQTAGPQLVTTATRRRRSNRASNRKFDVIESDE